MVVALDVEIQVLARGDVDLGGEQVLVAVIGGPRIGERPRKIQCRVGVLIAEARSHRVAEVIGVLQAEIRDVVAALAIGGAGLAVLVAEGIEAISLVLRCEAARSGDRLPNC